MDEFTPTTLAKAAGISKTYAWELLGGKPAAPAKAIAIYRKTGLKLPQLASLSEEDIDAYEAILQKVAA